MSNINEIINNLTRVGLVVGMAAWTFSGWSWPGLALLLLLCK